MPEFFKTFGGRVLIGLGIILLAAWILPYAAEHVHETGVRWWGWKPARQIEASVVDPPRQLPPGSPRGVPEPTRREPFDLRFDKFMGKGENGRWDNDGRFHFLAVNGKTYGMPQMPEGRCDFIRVYPDDRTQWVRHSCT